MSTLLHPREAPSWLAPLVEGCGRASADDIPLRRRPSDAAAREAAVLLLFGEADDGNVYRNWDRAQNYRISRGVPQFDRSADVLVP